MPTPTPTLSRTDAPAWARATALFAKEAFDVRSRDDFVSALEAFADLAPGERAFHQAHLVFRQVQALEDVHRVLVRIDRKLGALDENALAGLKQLPAIRKALVAIARGQQDLVDLMESGAGARVGDDDPHEVEEEDDDDESLDEDDDSVDDDASELADAVDAESVEDDVDHDEVEVVVPEVLPAGARREPALTADEVLARRDGGAS